MKFLAHIVIAVIANVVALLAASYLAPGFSVPWDPQGLLTIAVILALLNLILKPILKLLLGPVIIITFGIGLIVVNAILLFVLDALFPALTIQGIVPLLSGALVLGVVNFVFHPLLRS